MRLACGLLLYGEAHDTGSSDAPPERGVELATITDPSLSGHAKLVLLEELPRPLQGWNGIDPPRPASY